jgi:hypothetical protein
LPLNQSSQPVADDFMIIGNQDLHGSRRWRMNL